MKKLDRNGILTEFNNRREKIEREQAAALEVVKMLCDTASDLKAAGLEFTMEINFEQKTDQGFNGTISTGTEKIAFIVTNPRYLVLDKNFMRLRDDNGQWSADAIAAFQTAIINMCARESLVLGCDPNQVLKRPESDFIRPASLDQLKRTGLK